MFSVRLVTADSYQAQPLPQLDATFSEFRGSEIKHVPVIRIFGTTPNGEKTCMHVHGVFPYLFVPYTGEEDPGILAYRLAASLDAAINVSLGSATSNTQHVYSIQRVSGTPFYGYHRKEHQFLKIYFYNPAMVKRAADLLQNGSVLNQSLQPHESHINYILQFMMDYNIYGMSLVNLRCVKHRRLAQTLADLASSGQSLSSENSEIVYLPMNIERQSTCELEIDALASDILNRLDVENGVELNPGLAAIWDEERARRAQAGFQGGDSQLVNPKSPARPTFNPTDNDIYQEQRLARRLLMISQCDESTLSTTTNRSVAYAAEVREGEDLLNSSRLPNVSVQRVERIHHVVQDDSLENMSFMDSPMIPTSQNLTQDCSILGTDDMPLVDILAELARDNEENPESVDTDSLLGTRVSLLLNDNEKSDNDDEDIVDLNLTCLQLDSLGSLETAMNQVERNDTTKNLSSDINVSPFLSSYEISSCSSKTQKDDDTTSREKKKDVNFRNFQMPQYDGAGDVSPTLLNSDNEDVQENTYNAKDFNHFPEYSDKFEITLASRQSEKLDQSMKITSRKNSSTTNSDITIEYEGSNNSENFSNIYEIRDSNDVVSTEAAITPSTLTNETQFGNYNGYESFDRLLDIGNDYVPDFVDMQSSMEIGILLSSVDNEKAEFVGETNDQTIPLDTVLNGDPCFTESAELDKSDLTELRDQYVSLLGNSLLPDIHNNPRIDVDLVDSTTFNETNFTTIEKTCEITSTVKTPRATITSRDSSSSLENVTPNIQEPENRGLTKTKLNSATLDRDSTSCKEISRVSNDTADYNCNVVATWAELQNLQIIDKTENNVRLSRTRQDNNVKYRPGPRSMKRRMICLASPDKIAPSQVLRKNMEKIPLRVSNICHVSSSKVLRSSVSKSPTKRSSYTSSSLSSACETENNLIETKKTIDTVVNNVEERLSCGPLPNVARYTKSLSEESSEKDFPSLRTAASLDAFHRSIIGSDNPLADTINTLSLVKYSAYPLSVNDDNIVEPIIDDFQETSDNCRINDFEENSNIEEESLHGKSYYSSEKSENIFGVENRRHRHYVLSRFSKDSPKHGFTSDELWIIHKRKRGGNHSIFRPFSSVCTRQDCPLPVVLLQKIGQTNNDDIVVVPRNDELSQNNVLSNQTSNENILITENLDSRISTVETCDKNVELPQSQRLSRVRKTRRKSELSLLTSNEIVINETKKIDSSIVNDSTEICESTISRDLPENEIPCNYTQCQSPNEQITRDPYNTRKRSIGLKFGKTRRRNVRIPIENEDKDKKEMKKPRARTKYKDGNLPGIPGIVNYELPKQPRRRRRSRKIVLSSNNVNACCDNTSEELSKPIKKHLSSKLFPNWGAQIDTEKYMTNGVVIKKSTINGLVLKTKNVEISTEKRKGRSIKANFPISPIPKCSNANPRDDERDEASKFLNFSSTPEKHDKTRETVENNKIHVSTRQKKLPETVALSLLLQEAKSSNTRKNLKLLLQKRLNDKYTCKKIITEVPIKNVQDNDEKDSEKMIVPSAAITMEKSLTPIIPEFIKVRSKDEESQNIVDDENKLDNSIDSDAPSFETVTDVSSDAISDKNSESIVSLNNVTEICNHNEFDDSALSVEFCNSVDDGNNDIFDNDTAENSVITETTNVEEFPNSTKLTYDTDRYENAIKEANFFAGKDYTIDAVSNEIPTCLFEEDSNSIDKRMNKRVFYNNLENFNDSCDTAEIDTSSELSIDPRDLDVYDVESLTPGSSVSILDESIDIAESSHEICEIDESNVGASKKIAECIDTSEKSHVNEASTRIINRDEIIIEQESSFEEDSPSFEALSPEPRICSLVGKSLEDEFNVQLSSEVTKNSYKCDKTTVSLPIVEPKITGDENISVIIDDSSIMRNENLSVTIENSPSDNTSITNENLPITPNKESSTTIENSSITPISKSSITIEDSVDTIKTVKDIEEDNAKLDSEIKELVSQVVIEFKNELEISEMIENNTEAMSIIDLEIQLQSNVETAIAKYMEREKMTSLNNAKNNEFSINTEEVIDALEIVENDDVSLASSEIDEELSIDTARKNDGTAHAEIDDRASTCTEKYLETRISVENHDHLCSSTEKESEMQINAETETDLSSSTENQSKMEISVEKENESLANIENESETEVLVEKDNKLLMSTEKKSESPEISVQEEKEIMPSIEIEIESAMIVETTEKLSKNIERELELRKNCENEKDFSASTEMEIESLMIVEEYEKITKSSKNKIDPLMTRENKMELSSPIQMETESLTSVDDSKLPDDSVNDSELLMTCEKENVLTAFVQTETKSSTSPEEEKLSSSNENKSEEPMTFEKVLSSSADKESGQKVEEQKELLTSTRMEMPSSAIVERDEKIFESSEKESASTGNAEIQILPEAERKLLDNSPMEIQSRTTVENNDELEENSETESEPSMTRKNLRDLSSSIEKESKLPISIEKEKELLANPPMEIQSPRIVENNVELAESIEEKTATPMTRKKLKDLSSSTEKKSKLEVSIEYEPKLLANPPMEIQSPTIVENSIKLAESIEEISEPPMTRKKLKDLSTSIEKESKLPITIEKEKNHLANPPIEIQSPMIVENSIELAEIIEEISEPPMTRKKLKDLSSSIEKVSKVPISIEKGKEHLANPPIEIQSPTIIENSIKLAESIEEKLETPMTRKKLKDLSSSTEKQSKLPVSIEYEPKLLANPPMEIQSPTMVENSIELAESIEEKSEPPMTRKKLKDLSSSTEKESKLPISTEYERELLGNPPMQIQSPMIVENSIELAESIEEKSEPPMTRKKLKDLSSSTEKKSKLPVSIEYEQILLANPPMEIQSPTMVENSIELAESIEEISEPPMTRKKLKDLSSSIEKESKLPISIEKEKVHLANSSIEIQSPTIVENNVELAESIEEKTETPMTRRKLKDLSSSMEKKSKLPVSIEYEPELLANPPMEIQSPTMVENSIELAESIEEISEPPMTRKKLKDLSSSIEKESKLPISIEKEKEHLAHPSIEIQSPTIVENNVELAESIEKKTETPMTRRKLKDLSSSMEKKSKLPVSIEYEPKLLANPPMEIQSPTMVENSIELAESIEEISEPPMTRKKLKDLSSSIEKESKLPISIEKEKEHLANPSIEIQSPTIVKNNVELAESIEEKTETPLTRRKLKDLSSSMEKKSKLPLSIEYEPKLLANPPMEIQSPTMVENSIELVESIEEISEPPMTRKKLKDLSLSIEKESKLPISIEKEKEHLANPPMEFQSPTIVENNVELAESIEEISEPPMTRKKLKDLSSSIEKESKLPISIENERELLAKPPMEIQSPTIVENNVELAESIEEKTEPPMTRKKLKDLSSSIEKESKLPISIEKEREHLANPPIEIHSPMIVENSIEPAECIEEKTETPMTRKKLKDLSSSTEKKSKLEVSIEYEPKLLANPPMEIQSPTMVENSIELAEIIEEISEPPMTRKKLKDLSSSIEKESKLPISIEKEKEHLANPPIEIQSPTITENSIELAESIEEKSEPPMTRKKLKDISSSTEKKSKLPVSIEKEKEFLANPPIEIQCSMIVDKNDELAERIEEKLKPRMTRKKLKDLSLTTEKESKLPISIENERELLAKPPMEIQSPTIVENSVKLSKSIEEKSEKPMTRKKLKDLSSNTEKKSNLPISIEKERKILANPPMEILSPTIVENSDKLLESTDNQSQLRMNNFASSEKQSKINVSVVKEKEIFASTQVEIQSSTIVENNDKLPESKEKESEVQVICEKEKDISAITSLETEEPTIIDQNPKLLEITEKKTKLKNTVDKTQKSCVESPVKLSLTPDVNINVRDTKKRQKHSSNDTKKKDEQPKIDAIDDKERKTEDKHVKQSIIKLETNNILRNALLRKKKIQSIVENEENEKKNHAKESKIIASVNETSDSTENELVDINKNDVVVSVNETENKELNDGQFENISKETKSLINHDNSVGEATKKRVECRPVSIKLVNIDLSKIRYSATKNLPKPIIEEPPSSRLIKQDNAKETLHEKVSTKIVSSMNSDENTEDRGKIEKSIVEINSLIEEDVEKSTPTESQSSLHKKTVKTRKRYPKDMRMPERRSVRICAEMTLKLSQQESLSKISTESLSSRDENTHDDASTSRKFVSSESSLSRNNEDKKLQDSVSSSIKISKDNLQYKNLQEISTVDSSIDENLRIIIDDTSIVPSLQLESVEQDTEMNISQDLVLSEQIVANENSTSSTMIKTQRRERPRKILQTNSQEVTSSTKIIDENTAPIFDKPKRKNSQVQETFVDAKTFKPITEEIVEKIVDKTSTIVDTKTIDFERKIAETNVDTQNLMISSKKARSANDRSCKIRNIPKIQEHSTSKSARENKCREITKISHEIKSSKDQNSIEITNKDLNSSIISSVPKTVTNETDNIIVAAKIDEFPAEKPLLPEEIAREISKEICTEIVVTRQKRVDEKMELEISPIHRRRRGRSGKKSETSEKSESSENTETSKERKLSLEESVDGIAENFLVPDLSYREIVEEKKTLPKSLVTRRRRGRSGKISNVLVSESGPIKNTRNNVENILPISEILQEKISKDSTERESTAAIVLKRRGRSGKSPEIKLNSQQSDISSQQITDTVIETETSFVPNRRESFDISSEKNNQKLSSNETIQIVTKEIRSQEPKLLIRKITEDSVESMITDVPRRKDNFVIGTVVDRQKKLSQYEDSRSSVETKSREPTLVLEKIFPQNDETTISSMSIKRKGHSDDKQTTTEHDSSMQEIASNSHECESVLDKVTKEKIITFHRIKGRFSKKGKRVRGKNSHDETSLNEKMSNSRKNCCTSTESLNQKNLDENIDTEKVTLTNFDDTSTLESVINENSQKIANTETTTRCDSIEIKNTHENNTCLLDDSLPKDITENLPNNLVKPKKRVRFDEESIRRCQDYIREDLTSDEEIFESKPRKHYKLSLIKKSPNLTRVIETACAEKSNDSLISTNSVSSDFESICLSVRLKNCEDGKKENTINAKDKDIEETTESTFSRNDNVYVVGSSSLEKNTTRSQQLDKERITDVPKESQLSSNNECNLQSSSTTLEYNLSIFTKCSPDITKNICQSDRQTSTYEQPQKPMIVLKRLSNNLLKSHGIVYSSRDKIFEKISKKYNRHVENNESHDEDDDNFQWPSYDGAADLSSSDTDEDPDVTIAREEKRVCSYNSLKKATTTAAASTTPVKQDFVVTSRKRKLDFTDNATSTGESSNKRQARLTQDHNVTPKKTSYRTIKRTSMLKSPGRNTGNYSPLKIIVTSPKVRKDMNEPRINFSLDKQDDNTNAESSSTSSSTSTSTFLSTSISATTSTHVTTTTGCKNSRLHDNMLRGRFNIVKSSHSELGDKHATVAKMGSIGVGELDEIQSIDQTEQGTVNTVSATITRQTNVQSVSHGSTTLHRDGKEFRKKLVFSDDNSREYYDKLSILSTDQTLVETSKLQINEDNTEDSRIVDVNVESIEKPKNPNKRGTMMFDAVPGTSRSHEIGKVPESDDDDDDENDDVCNVTFTQYINSQINKNEASSSMNVNSTKSMKKITIMPKFKPPSRQRVIETMEKYGIPKCRNQEPFFSDPADVPKQKELGQKMPKVTCNDVKHLPPFVSSIDGITGLSRWRKMWLNEYHPLHAKSKDNAVKLMFAGNERVTMTPLVKPPTRKQVEDWLRARRYLEEEKKRKEENEESLREAVVVARNIEIQAQAVDNETNECLSDTSNLSIIEASPERTLVSNDMEKMSSIRGKRKLTKQGMFNRAEEIAKSDEFGREDDAGSSSETFDSREKSVTTRDTKNNSVMDPSLVDVLKKSRLFRDQEASRHLGVSCGQIEFLSDSTRSNVANENLQNAKALTRYQYLTIMCLEIHVETRGDLLPDAQHDPIAAIFYSVQSDVPPTSSIKPLEHGVMVLAETEKSKNKMYYAYSSNIPWTITFANNEEALLNSLINLITRTDPEILIGWELETLSWGYVFQRATSLGMNFSKRISRIPSAQWKWEIQPPDIEKLTEVKLPGRIVLDIWRIMRREAALLSYTFESVIHHVLNERIPCPSFKILTDWWNLEKLRNSRWRVVEHYSIRVLGIFRILDQLDIIGRTSELARLFGIQFYEVFSRGSQFRVESVMLRLAKPLNYIPVSPSPLQRASMRAMEALPLIMEPESKFYSDPLIVLDFQSLYPSIIIAHNYCFSTCLGRIEHIGQPQPFEFGAYTLRVPKKTALRLQGKVNYAPCGVAYVKSEVRLGILPRMLTEILETRFMVKKAMKDHKKDDKTLQRALHSRQMGLKFLANVTYGYTAANFSGRMPCIEVGDSVISKSKETLERAIKLVESTPKWGARVVYGDTDSLFILVPGRSKADAFVIGNEIADAVTASNPPPIKLRFEKVMYPAILQTKKRYCGYMYESPEQEKPTYLAKGIETVRRDGCPAVSKILEKTLKILFETKDVSLVKKYVTRQLDKVLRGKVSIQDLTFAKEFRGFKGYKPRACVPALELTRRLMRKDPRAVPRNGERVRYVIVAGAPNQALIHCVRTPWELIKDPGLRPNAIYYVTRVIIPPLNRCFNLMGVDVNAWYREMPHRQILDNPVGQPSDKQKMTIFQYFGTIVCVSCGQPSNKGICTECLERPADTLVVMYEKLRWLDRSNNHVTAICQSCVGQADAADCASLDCPVLYRRAQAQRELTQAIQLREIIRCGNNLEF